MEKHTDRILELKSIYYSYHNADGETPAITDLSFSVNESEFIAIVGPSGCGKSTLLSLISGLITPERGQDQREILAGKCCKYRLYAPARPAL